MTLDAARVTAFEILLRVGQGSYASDLLYAHTATLESRDAGLASELVFGVLRYRSQLDYLIEHWSGRKAPKLDPEVRIILQLGIYQLRYLDRIPRHAGVSTSVDLAKHARKRSATGFVNAVLRKVNREPVAWPDRATELCQQDWLLERWDRQYGAETAETIARAFLAPPETFVRSSEPLPGLEQTEVAGCYHVSGKIPGGVRIQDIGSQSIVPLLELSPGQTVLDLCAAPGNKTSQILEHGATAVACDVHQHRLKGLAELGCPLVVLDASQPLPFTKKFDRILIDAPCTGTGTLGRNPEIKWRIRPSGPSELSSLQSAILRNALDCLAPGGRVVYSTCSLEIEENEAVVVPYHPVRIERRLPGIQAGDGFFAAVIA
jgi:16S rRNA (cytosine967-C5)-methyltransferase